MILELVSTIMFTILNCDLVIARSIIGMEHNGWVTEKNFAQPCL